MTIKPSQRKVRGRPKGRRLKTEKQKTEIPKDLSLVELRDLATAGECSVSYVSRVFSHDQRQTRGLTLTRAKKFADRLGVSLDRLYKIVTD